MSLVIFSSHNGSGFQAFVDAIESQKLKTKIQLLVCDHKNTQVVLRAQKHHIPIHYLLNPKEPHELLKKLKAIDPELILLCGFVKKIPPLFLKEFPKKFLNIHPSLLPQYGGKGFYGLNIHKEVIKNKEAFTGITVHWVNEDYDQGEIIEQIKVAVRPHDTAESLQERLKPLEHKLYLKVVKNLLKL